MVHRTTTTLADRLISISSATNPYQTDKHHASCRLNPKKISRIKKSKNIMHHGFEYRYPIHMPLNSHFPMILPSCSSHCPMPISYPINHYINHRETIHRTSAKLFHEYAIHILLLLHLYTINIWGCLKMQYNPKNGYFMG